MTAIGDGAAAVVPPEPTDGPKSERRLARSLGYPPTWHVVRRVPHPADGGGGLQRTDSSSSQGSVPPSSFQDRIYAGDPRSSSGSDLYYNHSSASTAALRWLEGESTPHFDGGGQMLPRVAGYAKGDKVEVYYEPDGTWYRATIERVRKYEDDVR